MRGRSNIHIFKYWNTYVNRYIFIFSFFYMSYICWIYYNSSLEWSPFAEKQNIRTCQFHVPGQFADGAWSVTAFGQVVFTRCGWGFGTGGLMTVSPPKLHRVASEVFVWRGDTANLCLGHIYFFRYVIFSYSWYDKKLNNSTWWMHPNEKAMESRWLTLFFLHGELQTRGWFYNFLVNPFVQILSIQLER